MMDQNEIAALETLTQHVHFPLAAALQKLDEANQAIANLAGNTCTGSIWWRDPNSDKPRMYINHRKDQVCPLHGMPNRGKRIRTYIGSDPDKQAEAHATLDAETRLDALRQTKRQLDAALSQARYRLRDYYRALRYTVPDHWQPAADPEPDPRRPW